MALLIRSYRYQWAAQLTWKEPHRRLLVVRQPTGLRM